MEEVLKINSIDDYNKLFGLETRHPLVSVVDLSQATRWPTQAVFNYGIYVLFLKDVKCGDIRYGRQLYDYQEGTIVSFSPGQIAGVNMPSGVRPAAHGLYCSIPTLSGARHSGKRCATTRSFPTSPTKPYTSPKRNAKPSWIAWARYKQNWSTPSINTVGA